MQCFVAKVVSYYVLLAIIVRKWYNFSIEKDILDKEIRDIKLRNSRVELDKKWETSWTRRLCICFMTYIIVVFYSF